MDGIITQFLSKSTTSSCEQEDIKFLLKYANGDFSAMKSDADTFDITCLGLVKMRLQLENVLSRGWSKNGQIAKPLNFHKTEVCI